MSGTSGERHQEGTASAMSGIEHAVDRTRLAWRRTTLAAAAVLLLAVSGILVGNARPMVLAAGGILALLWLSILTVAHWRISTLQRGITQRAATNTAGRSPALMAMLVAGYAALGILLVR